MNKSKGSVIWINEHILLRRIKILKIWESDYKDFRCNAILYQNNKPVANIIMICDSDYYGRGFDSLNSNYSYNVVINTFKKLIYNSFDKYLNLPKISECSDLLNKIYDIVCESDANMCYITDKDWTEDFSKKFTNKDIDFLKEEVKKYGLENVIEFNEMDYIILGYSNLETCFNDDRYITKAINYER